MTEPVEGYRDFQEPSPESIREPIPAGVPFWSWLDVLIFLVCAASALAVGGLLAAVAKFLLPIPNVTPAMLAIVAQFLGYGLMFVALAQLLKARYHAPFWQSIAWNTRVPGIEWAYLKGLAIAGVLIVLGALLKTPRIDTPMEAIMKDPRNAIVVAIFAVTLGPVAEEVIFRGFLMPILIRDLNLPAGIFLSSLAFALLHGQQYAWSWQHVTLILVAGCAFGYIRYRTGSTAYAALVHSGYNSFFLMAYFIQKWID
ncbi:MAG TPA: type II CAAX endopeptidase family protein [Bryobacteraceae bacterium]|nr:type II CAAX endopeptidase family protein [Bryobacteraceae bacterium]